MKIALFDLNHMTRGVHTNTVPLGLGLISVYLEKSIGGNFEIKIFKDTQKALKDLSSSAIDIAGISQYSWNSELNLFIAKWIRQKYPNCMIVAGGPNLSSSEERRRKFLLDHPYVDICVAYDGEIPFANLVKKRRSGESVKEIKKNPVSGCYSMDPDSKELICNDKNPPRLESLDVFGPIYVSGRFDELLDSGYHPFLQTHSGC